MTIQNTEPDQPDEFAGVREAYLATPTPRPAAVEAAVVAAKAAVMHAAPEHAAPEHDAPGRDATDSPRLRTRERSWRHWTPIVLLAAACLLVLVRWSVVRRDRPVPQVATHSTARASAPLETMVAAGPPPVLRAAPSVAIPTPRSTPRPFHIGGLTPAPKAAAPTTAAVTPPPAVAQGVISHDSVPVPEPVAAAPRVTLAERDRAVQGLDEESATLVLRVLDSATARGLPLAPLATRVREGVRRGIPGPRIVVVVRNYAAALAGAHEALGAGAGGVELQAGAEAILAGAPTAALRQIRTARREGSVAEPLMALADLATHGVSPLRASAALAALVTRGGSDDPVRALRAEVIGDIVRGVSPDAALAGRLRSAGDQPRGGRPPLGGTRDSTPLSGGVP